MRTARSFFGNDGSEWRAGWVVALSLGALVGVPTGASASHTIFSSAVERFEADGNVFGTPGGPVDFSDEFDDGTLAPHWAVLLGTAVESGGVLTLKNPGVDISLVPGVALDISTVENEDAILNGAGDLTMTSWWAPTLPATNTGFHFQTYAIGSSIEAAGLTFDNVDGAYAISQQLTFIGTAPVPPDTQTVPIDPGDVTGSIVLRLVFDDAADTLVGSFSLDGGTTFQSPFTPVPILNVSSDTDILLGANSAESTDPGPGPDCSSILGSALILKSGSLGLYDERLTFSGTLVPPLGFPTTWDPTAEGVTALFDFLGTGQLVIDALPASSGKCRRADGWRTNTRGSTYRNESFYVPPACSSFGPGRFRMKLKTGRIPIDGTIPIKLSIRDAGISSFPPQLNVAIFLGPTAVGGEPRACMAATLTCQGSVVEGKATCQ